MRMYNFECDEIDAWLTLRKDDLSKAWGDAVYEVTRGSPWAMEVNVRLEDAIDTQARAERWAYMRGEPVPNADTALAELLAWVRNGKVRNGGAHSLPLLPYRNSIPRPACLPMMEPAPAEARADETADLPF
jgi:hypothetical protein